MVHGRKITKTGLFMFFLLSCAHSQPGNSKKLSLDIKQTQSEFIFVITNNTDSLAILRSPTALKVLPEDSGLVLEFTEPNGSKLALCGFIEPSRNERLIKLQPQQKVVKSFPLSLVRGMYCLDENTKYQLTVTLYDSRKKITSATLKMSQHLDD